MLGAFWIVVFVSGLTMRLIALRDAFAWSGIVYENSFIERLVTERI